MSAYKVLMTKKIDAALVQKAKAENVELHEIQFIKIEPCPDKRQVTEVLQRQVSVAFTSKNAVIIVSALLGDKKPDWRIFCIEGGTANEVADRFGQEAIAGTARTAKGLAETIAQKSPDKEVVFFCGEKRRDDLPDILKEKDIEVEEVVVYETKLFPEEVWEHFDGIAFFSPSAVESFFSVNVVDDKTIFFAIGPTTGESLRKLAKNKVVICDMASEESMLEAILRATKNNNG